MTHKQGNYDTLSPVYAKIPNFIYKNTYTTVNSYKIGRDATNLNANMVNQTVGPFDQSTNTIVITVTKKIGGAIIN